MTRVLVAWEDALCEPLGLLANRTVSAMAPPGATSFPHIVRHSPKSNGQFDRYVSKTWSNACRNGMPVDPGPIDHLICVIDADRLHDLIGITKPPSEPTSVAAWHHEASSKWETWLRDRRDPAGPAPSTIHGVVLRWCKESFVLAGYDQPLATLHLRIDLAHVGTAALLVGECQPDPAKVADAAFTDTFRKPRPCLDAMRKAQKLSPIAKNAPEIDDMLDALAKDRAGLAMLRARVPDLDRLAALIWTLHRGSPPAGE